MAAIASSLLVEMLVSLLQHALGNSAPAPTGPTDNRGDHPLGIVPHQIRGFLSTFQTVVLKGKSYDHCSACSEKITSAYKADGWRFVMRALNEKGYIEDLSGLAEVSNLLNIIRHGISTDESKVQRMAEKALADMELSDEGSQEEEGEGEII